MPVIISNSSPIIHLAKIGRLKPEGKIESFDDAFEQIRATGFWVHESLKRRFLTEAGEL
jgi:predicted nucleic acid-binding protein